MAASLIKVSHVLSAPYASQTDNHASNVRTQEPEAMSLGNAIHVSNLPKLEPHDMFLGYQSAAAGHTMPQQGIDAQDASVRVQQAPDAVHATPQQGLQWSASSKDSPTLTVFPAETVKHAPYVMPESNKVADNRSQNKPVSSAPSRSSFSSNAGNNKPLATHLPGLVLHSWTTQSCVYARGRTWHNIVLYLITANSTVVWMKHIWTLTGFVCLTCVLDRLKS